MTPLRTILWPFALLFGAAVRLRAWCYRTGICRQQRLNGVVISVGNLTVGGTGKTPMTIWIARKLASEGKRVGVLTRGYRGHRLEEAGQRAPKGSAITSDEAIVMQKQLGEQVRIGIGADRFTQGTRLEREGVEWLVLDDGFQHLQLARNLDVVLIDATNPFGEGHLLPAGRLREPLSSLARADIVVITRSEHAPAVESRIQRHTPAPIYYAQAELDGVFRLEPGILLPETVEKLPQRAFAFCGVGNPPAFFADLRRWGTEIMGRAAFADHHAYTRADMQRLERLAKEAGAEALVCTLKDFANFGAERFCELPVYFVRTDLRIEREDEFWQTVLAIIARKRAGAAR
jgi:tetraacyldisaccharide 4'-kinase